MANTNISVECTHNKSEKVIVAWQASKEIKGDLLNKDDFELTAGLVKKYNGFFGNS